eukprot:2272072-Rhodomonas_salina.1
MEDLLLSWCMLLRACYALPGTDLRHAATAGVTLRAAPPALRVTRPAASVTRPGTNLRCLLCAV